MSSITMVPIVPGPAGLPLTDVRAAIAVTIKRLSERDLSDAASRQVTSDISAAEVRSGGAGRLSMPIVGSPSIQPWRCHQPIALRAIDSSRFTVSASIPSARAAASSASTSGSTGSSIAVTGKCGGFAPRRAGPVGAGSPANIHPHVVSEIR